MISKKRQALLWATIFLFLVAFILHIEQLFWMSAATALILPLSSLLARRKLVGLSISRKSPQTLTAGETANIALTVSNDAAARRLFIEAHDGLPDRASPNRTSQMIPVLAAGATTEVNYSFETTLRGVYRLGPLRLEATDTLGISEYSRTFDDFAEILVYPTPISLPNLWPQGGAANRARTPRRALKGDGLDYYGIREYTPGDDVRRMDWKSTARSDTLMVREFHKEVSLYAVGVLDLYAAAHAGKGEFSTLEQGVVLAASVMKQAVDTAAPTAFIAVGRDDYTVAEPAFGSQTNRLMEALARAELTETDNWPDAVVQRLSIVPRGASVCVFSPRTDDTAVKLAQRLKIRELSVAWFILDAGGHPNHHRDVSETAARLSNMGCTVHLVDCTRPLQNQFSQGHRSYVQTI
ncbi:MAG: DUF58 domain-containing protein [Armatimonadota bacterium]